MRAKLFDRDKPAESVRPLLEDRQAVEARLKRVESTVKWTKWAATGSRLLLWPAGFISGGEYLKEILSNLGQNFNSVPIDGFGGGALAVLGASAYYFAAKRNEKSQEAAELVGKLALHAMQPQLPGEEGQVQPAAELHLIDSPRIQNP